jgi:hypothetical protein
MTLEDEIKVALELCEKATPGPWFPQEINGTYHTKKGCVWNVPDWKDPGETGFCVATINHYCGTEADAEFLAASREGWPRALKQLQIAIRALDRYTQSPEHWPEDVKKYPAKWAEEALEEMGKVK